MMKNKSRLTILALAFLLVSACSGVMDSKQAARQTYLLTPDPSIAGATAPATAPSLAVAISVVPGLDTDRVMALGPDARLSPYANARWPDHLPEVITSVLKRSLASSGRFSSVEASSRAADDGWSLTLELQQFYGIQNSTGETSSVRVEFAGTLMCNGKNVPLRLSDSNSVSEERLSAVVAAHQRGLNGVTRELLEQVNNSCS
jgi:ABC-type uncharacterized transport system auxiliary subunit